MHLLWAGVWRQQDHPSFPRHVLIIPYTGKRISYLSISQTNAVDARQLASPGEVFSISWTIMAAVQSRELVWLAKVGANRHCNITRDTVGGNQCHLMHILSLPGRLFSKQSAAETCINLHVGNTDIQRQEWVTDIQATPKSACSIWDLQLTIRSLSENVSNMKCKTYKNLKLELICSELGDLQCVGNKSWRYEKTVRYWFTERYLPLSTSRSHIAA